MADLVTLKVPSGAEGFPISHGATSYRAYLADPGDANSHWHVDVPQEVAQHLAHNGGFAVVGPARSENDELKQRIAVLEEQDRVNQELMASYLDRIAELEESKSAEEIR
jgi:hypothetical protein